MEQVKICVGHIHWKKKNPYCWALLVMLLLAYFSLSHLECNGVKAGGSTESKVVLKTWPSVHRGDRKCNLPIWPPVLQWPCDMEDYTSFILLACTFHTVWTFPESKGHRKMGSCIDPVLYSSSNSQSRDKKEMLKGHFSAQIISGEKKKRLDK